jgi:hypothetical protein
VNGYPTVSGVGLEHGPVSNIALASVPVTQPAAGADFTLTVPDAGQVWEIVAVRARFVTSAAVANRFLTFNVKDAAGNIVFQTAFGTAVTASITEGVVLSQMFASVSGDVSNTKIVTLPLPEGPYLPRWTINSVTTAIDTGDQWSQIVVWYRQLGLGAPPSEG